MPDEQTKAKVFISCGQRRNSDEVEIAHRIGERLTELGCELYIAVEEQSLLGVRENLLRQLESSEYFLFIDFKREQLLTDYDQVWRGSLFSHQELAIASYLGIPLMAFQERGVKQQDGLMRFLQSKAIQFTDRALLPNVIADEVQQRGWNPNWKNGLLLEREAGQYVDARRLPANRIARFFHITVRNLHERKMARNCYAYLQRVRQIPSGIDIPVETIEFKWAGYLFPNAVIGPRQVRRFDAFWVFHDTPGRLQFNVIADSTEFVPRIGGIGDYHLTYTVISENFAPTKQTFALHVGDRLEDIQFQVA